MFLQSKWKWQIVRKLLKSDLRHSRIEHQFRIRLLLNVLFQFTPVQSHFKAKYFENGILLHCELSPEQCKNNCPMYMETGLQNDTIHFISFENSRNHVAVLQANYENISKMSRVFNLLYINRMKKVSNQQNNLKIINF